MARLGFKCLKPGSVPGKSDPQLQMVFFEQSLRPNLEEARKGLRKVYFVDASHFARGPYLKRLWSVGRCGYAPPAGEADSVCWEPWTRQARISSS